MTGNNSNNYKIYTKELIEFMRKSGKVFFWCVIFLVFFLYSNYTMTLSHENAHRKICLYFNGTVTDYEINIFGTSHVSCPNPNFKETYLLAQSNVEAYGYQMGEAMEIIMFLGFLLGALYIANTEDEW